MKYSEVLKQEVELYLSRLKAYKEADFSKAKKILEEKSSEIVIEKSIKKASLEQEATRLGEQIELYEAYCKNAHNLKYNIEKKIMREKELQVLTQAVADLGIEELQRMKVLSLEISKCKNSVDDSYTKLLQLQDEAKKFGAVSEPTSEQIAELREKQKSTSEAAKNIRNERSAINLLETINDSDRKEVTQYLISISNVVLEDGIIKVADYPNLLQLIALATFKPECADCAPALNSNFSNECRTLFDEILNETWRYDEIDCQGLIDTAFEEEIAQHYKLDVIDGALRFKIVGVNYGFLFVTEAFLKAILEQIEKNPEANLPRLATALFEIYDTDAAKRQIASDMSRTVTPIDKLIQMRKEFQSLYEETPEQIMIREQRDYHKQRIEEMREKNRLEEDRIAMEREFEEEARAREERHWREEQERAEERWREERRREDRRREEERKERMQAERRAEEERKRAQMEKKRQEERENRERREQQREAARARQEAMHLCWRCANYGRGCKGGIPACGNFRAK